MLPDRIEVETSGLQLGKHPGNLSYIFGRSNMEDLNKYNTVPAKLDMISSKFLPISKKLGFLWGQNKVNYPNYSTMKLYSSRQVLLLEIQFFLR